MRRGFVAVLVLVAGCAPTSTAVSSTSMVPTTTTTVPTTTTTVPTTTTMATTTTINPYARPDWLGTRLLPLRPDEFGVVQPTPPEMQDRQFETLDVLPPPADEGFHSTIDTDPTRRPGPLQLGSGVPSDPRRAFLSDDVPLWIRPAFPHRGDDRERRRRGTGGRDLPETSRGRRFPIEQMRVITKEEIDAHPTGDWNDTTSFVCRPAVGSTSWSQHAYGTGIDINPFHNPYLKGDLVLPELASAYVDREDVRVGMIVPGDVATESFAEIGWGWGGHWSSLKDWMHFSLSGS